MQKQQHKLTFIVKLTVAVIALICAMIASCCLGSSNTTLHEVLLFFTGRKDELSASAILIIGQIRIPRVLMAVLVGGSLSMIGSVMQGVFKNPMADPSVLGVSSGSALGATVAIMFGATGTFLAENITGTYIGAIIGALITFAILFAIVSRNSEYDNSTTLLTGVALSSIMTGLITLLMTLHLENMERIYMWMLGSVSFSTLSRVKIFVVVVVVTTAIVIIYSPRIDILKLGRETALTMGVSENSTMGIILTSVSVLLAFCVANSGMIGFVGLIVPHIVSFFKIYKARERVIMSFVVGGLFLLICDTIAKTIVAPGELALGAVTSLVGAPYFLWLLIRSRVKSGKKEVKF